VDNSPLIRVDETGLIFETHGWENSVYPANYNTDPLGDCRIGCYIDFLLPINEKTVLLIYGTLVRLNPKLASQAVKALLKKYTKVFDIGVLTDCLDNCNKKFKRCNI
jgi:hypothetical protein